MKTINACVKDLRDRNIYQWNENYPNDEIIKKDIENNSLHIIKIENECLAIIVINEIQDEEWKKVTWSKTNNKPLVIHRLIVHPNSQSKGIGKKLITFAIDYAIQNNYDSIRFDAYSENKNLLEMYERMNCIKKGEVYFPHREKSFYCYERNLK
jgi:ribosomal protein S18 acetylase RimI-like enzyme